MGSGCLKPTCYGHQILDQIARNLWKIFLKIDSATISNWKILIKRKQKKFQTKVRVVTNNTQYMGRIIVWLVSSSTGSDVVCTESAYLLQTSQKGDQLYSVTTTYNELFYGGGIVVTALAFYFFDPSSNLAKVCSF